MDTAREEKVIEIATKLINSEIDIEIIIQSTGLTKEQIGILKK